MGRQHHYQFAHRVLPATPAEAWRRLAGELRAGRSVDGVLHRVWRSLGEELPVDDRIEPNGLSASIHEAGPVEIVLVTMPLPLEPPEAYFGAAVLPSHEDPVRYLTLELGFDIIEQRPYTVGGEWTSDAHFNLGEGPLPTVTDFLDWLQPRIGRS